MLKPALVLVALVAVVTPAAAGAWTLPTNAGATPGAGAPWSYCIGATDSGGAALLSDTTTLSLTQDDFLGLPIPSSWSGGDVDVDLTNSTMDAITLQLEYPGGQYRDVPLTPVLQGSGSQVWTATVDIPAFGNGTVVADLDDRSGNSTVSRIQIAPAGTLNAQAELAQVACLDAAGAAATAHADAGTLDGDLKQIDTDVQQLHTDNVALESEFAGGSGGTGGGTGDQLVSLDTSSEQFLDGEAQALHLDLWVIVGAIVGTLVIGELLRRVFP